MSDLIGRTLGHYRVVEQIGAGGMGVVYRARDERLDRDVAIKVLPEAMAQDPERLARFEREAKLLASLSHQNIATLYGLEEHAGERYLVMELVEGETLADRIARGALPVDESLAIACQIAEGLETAHGQGIIHRDLKPANVMLSPEGKVKILDFGLAKAWVNELSGVDLTHSPTITAEMTASGALMGTAAYMSPEQARGKRVDKRTDIWAFGGVLYEMLTGHRAFPGGSLSETMASILKEEPDWSALPGNTSPTVQRLLRRCLRKDPNHRLHDIADARIAIEEAGEVDQDAPPTPASTGWTPTARAAAVAAVAVAILGIIVGVFGARWLNRPAPQSPLAVQIETIEPLPENVGRTRHIAVSPDGRHLVYVVGDSVDNHLVHRPLDSFEATAIPGTAGAAHPVFSPNGRWVAFSVDGESSTLKKVSLDGGQPVDLCADCGGTATWSPDGRHVLFTWRRAVNRVSAAGGELTVVKQPADDQQWFSRPAYLPDGRTALVEVHDTQRPRDPAVGVLNLESEQLEILVPHGTSPSFAASGHLLFAREKDLFAVAFDADSLRCTGEPVRVRDDISFIGGHNAQYNVSQNGLLAFVEWSPATWTGDDRSLVWVDRTGRSTQATPRFAAFSTPSLSPDCTRVAAAVIQDGSLSQIEIFDIEATTWSRLTTGGRYKYGPVWTRDGSRIAFAGGGRGQRYQVYSIASDFSSNQSAQLFEHQTSVTPSSFSPTGDLVFSESVGATKMNILRLPSESGVVRNVVRGPFRQRGGMVSLDGAWLAYVSNRSGSDEVYVEPFPEGGPRTQISSGGGSTPHWARLGDELFYLNDGQLISVPVRTQPDFAITGDRQILFKHDACLWGVYDVDCDGQRFLMVQPSSDAFAEPRERQRINLVFNFFDELERLVPTK